MRFFLAAICSAILFSSFSASAKPNTNCESFLTKAAKACARQTVNGTKEDAAEICGLHQSVLKQVCEAGQVEDNCQDWVVSSGAGMWIACVQFLSNKDTGASPQQIDNFCLQAGEVQAAHFAQLYCPVKPQKPESIRLDI